MTRFAFAATAAFTLVSGTALAAPAWIDGKDPKYTRQEYILGVGKGPDKKSADIDARAEVSRVFESNVAAVAKDFQAAASSVNSAGKGVSVEVQAISQYQEVTTKKTLSAVELREHGVDGKTHYTLAVLSREQCINSLKEQIENLDGKIDGAVAKGENAGDDKMGAFKGYGNALNMMDEREGLNAMLRVCDLGGKGIPARHSIGDLASKFEAASGEFKLGVDVQGTGAARVRDCLMEQLNEKGYQITEIQVDEDEEEDEDDDDSESNGSKSYDAIILGRLKSEKAGEIAGSVMVRTDLTLKLINPKTKKTVKTASASRKEGRRDVKQSAALSAFKLCQQEMPKLVKDIDKYFKR